MRTALLILLLAISHAAPADDVMLFYMRQIPGDLENFTLISNGKGMSSQIVSKKRNQVFVDEKVFDGLWSKFPVASLAPYVITDSKSTKINALHNHVLRIVESVDSKKTESMYMVPHSSSPQQVTAWLTDFLNIFGATVLENASVE
ncbi:MAG: hypothetical protein ABW124_22705 [Candidatus Thiodiazotropha sp. 6PLUC9]